MLSASEARLRELHAERAQLMRKQKRTRRAERDAARAEARRCLCAAFLHTALIIHVSCEGGITQAAKYFVDQAAQRWWVKKTNDELEQPKRVQALVGLTDEAVPFDFAPMRIAQSYVLEWRLYTWALKLNRTRGEAPSADMVLQRFGMERRSLGENKRPLPRFPRQFGEVQLCDGPPLQQKRAE